MERKGHIFVLLVFLVLVSVVVSPISAVQPITTNLGLESHSVDQVTDFTYTAPDGLAVAGIEVRVPYGTDLTFSINGGDSTGTIQYSGDTLSSSHTVTIGSDSNTFNFPGDVLHAAFLHKIGPASNGTGDRGYFVSTEVFTSYYAPLAYDSVTNASPIRTITFNSNLPVNLMIITESYEKASADLAPGGLGDLIGGIGVTDVLKEIPIWVGIAMEMMGTIKDLVLNIFWWLKFFFWDNGLLITVLYFATSMAHAAMSSVTSKGFDVFRFYKKFIGFQVALYRFMIEMWQLLVLIISQFAELFKLI
jgi:hypothetical protein